MESNLIHLLNIKAMKAGEILNLMDNNRLNKHSNSILKIQTKIKIQGGYQANLQIF